MGRKSRERMTSTSTASTLNRQNCYWGWTPYPILSGPLPATTFVMDPNDIDVTLYSLKKWAGLACKGNPTALHFLFTEGVLRSGVWKEIVAHKDVFLARVCAKQFVGFADDQLKRMTGQKGRGKKGQRPEFQKKFG